MAPKNETTQSGDKRTKEPRALRVKPHTGDEVIITNSAGKRVPGTIAYEMEVGASSVNAFAKAHPGIKAGESVYLVYDGGETYSLRAHEIKVTKQAPREKEPRALRVTPHVGDTVAFKYLGGKMKGKIVEEFEISAARAEELRKYYPDIKPGDKGYAVDPGGGETRSFLRKELKVIERAPKPA